jgi:hypothetical protein
MIRCAFPARLLHPLLSAGFDVPFGTVPGIPPEIHNHMVIDVDIGLMRKIIAKTRNTKKSIPYRCIKSVAQVVAGI